MTDSRDNDRADAVFSWGKKKTKGGKNRSVQFYESFTYDGVEYFLYDSVYLFKEGEVDPYVGKLIKIYEHSNKSRKVKILWFFKPCEISYYLNDEKVLENELFLASGEGVGLANINPLEAIAGKCNAVCISKDERNREPSTQELEKADYVFYRTFDVGNFIISDKLGEQIAATEVRYLLNKKDSTDKNIGNLVIGIDAPLAIIRSTPQEDEVTMCGTNVGPLLIKDGLTDEPVLLSGQKTRSSSPDYDLNDLDKVIESAVNVGQSNYKTSPKFELGVVDSKEKTKNDDSKTVDSGTNSARALTPVALSTAKSKSEGGDKGIHSSVRALGEVKTKNNYGSKKPELDGTGAPSSNKDKNGVRKPLVVEPNNGGKLVTDSDDRTFKKLKLDGTTEPSNNKGKNGARNSLVSSSVNQALGSTADEGKLVKDPDGTRDGVSKKLNKKHVSSDSADAETNVMGKLGKEFVGTSLNHSKKLKSENGISKKLDCEGIENKSNVRLPKASPKQCLNGDIEDYGQVKEVTRRPKSGRSHWFGTEHWDDCWKAAQNQGTLILLQNLDPSYTSSEIEDMVWHGFRESCTAKMLQKVATSSPYSGEAFVIFKSQEAAKRVSYKLDHECLMLPNGRPLVGRLWVSSIDVNQSSFPGHLLVDKLRHQFQREAKAVSTSHSSQANTVEYEMAVEWRLLQDRSDLWWKLLYKEQGRELRKLKANLKTK